MLEKGGRKKNPQSSKMLATPWQGRAVEMGVGKPVAGNVFWGMSGIFCHLVGPL